VLLSAIEARQAQRTHAFAVEAVKQAPEQAKTHSFALRCTKGAISGESTLLNEILS
jgi:hypothetical protein